MYKYKNKKIKLIEDEIAYATAKRSILAITKK